VPAPEHVIVGRIRRAHGIRGEVVVEAITDDATDIFVDGRVIVAGTADGSVSPGAQVLTIRGAKPFKRGWIVRFAEIADRNAAALWQSRYLLMPSEELRPPAADEVYYHDLVGLKVEHSDGSALGSVAALFEVPQGLLLEVKTERGTVMVPYRPEVVTSVDVGRGTVVVDPPEGLFD
jgi:16S rRNA processing protein RimM